AGRPDLTGEPETLGGFDAGQRFGLEPRRWRQRLEPLRHPYPTSGAPGAAAAHRRMRNAVGAQRLEHGRARLDAHTLAVRVSEQRWLPQPINETTYGAAGERQQQQSEISTQDAALDAVPRGGTGFCAIGVAHRGGDKTRLLGFAKNVIAGGDVAGNGQRRYQQRDDGQWGAPDRIPPLGV